MKWFGLRASIFLSTYIFFLLSSSLLSFKVNKLSLKFLFCHNTKQVITTAFLQVQTLMGFFAPSLPRCGTFYLFFSRTQNGVSLLDQFETSLQRKVPWHRERSKLIFNASHLTILYHSQSRNALFNVTIFSLQSLFLLSLLGSEDT